MNPRAFTFRGGNTGPWVISEIKQIVGEPLGMAARLEILSGDVQVLPEGAVWALRGVTSNQRYVTRTEQIALAAVQPPLARPEATSGALIPLTKSPAWWDLTQDERRDIFEAQSAHIAVGMRYLPAIARKLHHSRDLGEPFDFLTWFEFAPSETNAFDDLLEALRGTPEWKFVTHEVEVRVTRCP